MPQSDVTYRPLGAFRLLLASLVVVSHLRYLAGSSLDFLGPLGLGNPAVMVFFVLSGYVIAEALAVFYRDRTGAFLINRFLRIYPPFFVALALGWIVHWALAQHHEIRFFDPVSTQGMFSADNLLANSLRLIVLYGHGILKLPQTDYVFLRMDWAVAIEVQFYVTIALLSWIAPKWRYYWHTVTALLLAAFVVSMFTGWKYGSGWIPYFILGIAIYRRSHALALLCLALVNWHAAVYIGANAQANVAGALSILNALIAALWFLSRSSTRWRSVDAWLGDLTYPIYLNHYTVGIVALTLFVPSPTVFIAACIATVLFSYGTMLMTEPVTKRWRDRMRGVSLSSEKAPEAPVIGTKQPEAIKALSPRR